LLTNLLASFKSSRAVDIVTHLLLELTTTRQKYDEEISTFYNRLGKLFHLTLNVQTKDKGTAVAEVKEGILKTQTLNIFIEGLRQPIKMLAKASHPRTIEEAFSVAQQEETSYKSDKKTQSKMPKQETTRITCFNCGKVGVIWPRYVGQDQIINL